VMRRIILWRANPRTMTGVNALRVDMLVYISASQSQKRRVLSPTRLE
jgi:hypothetical protein